MANTDRLLKKDFLVKRSQMKSFITKENYKGRWFELTSSVLRYSDGSLESGIGKVKGQIALSTIQAVEVAESEHLGQRSNAFQVVYKGDEVNILYIMAVHETQRTDWIETLRDACLKANARFSLKYHPGVWLNKPRRFSCCDSINKRSEGCFASSYSASRNSQTPSTSPNRLSPGTQINRGLDMRRGSSDSQFNSIMRPLPQTPNDIQVLWKGKEMDKVLALHNYKALQTTDLDLVKGEQYYVLKETGNDGWYMAKNKDGREGYIPANYVQDVDDESLEQYEWFRAKTSRLQSEEILKKDGREGVFLVRDSSQGDFKYTLSVYTKSGGNGFDGIIKHYHIKLNSEGLYFLAEKHAFQRIPDLIYYHKHNCAGLVVRLRSPPSDRSSMKPICGLGHNLKEIEYSELSIKEELGWGQFGKVHRGLYKGSVEVAVKTMKEGSMLEEDFIEEAKTMMEDVKLLLVSGMASDIKIICHIVSMSIIFVMDMLDGTRLSPATGNNDDKTNLKHDKLVLLLGVCTKSRPLVIVTEFMKNGALLHYLRRHKGRLLPNTGTLVEMCEQVCEAMQYLEEKAIIHRDLAARNCLVGEANIVKVGDFGLARFVLDNEYTCSAGAKFPVKWSSPEVLNFTKFSSKSDVWAYGVLMWEIFSGGESPYTGMKNVDIVNGVCNQDVRLSKPKYCPSSVYDIMSNCWHKLPEDRPNFCDILAFLHTIELEREYVD